MKLFGQVDLKAVLVPVVSSAITAAGTFVATKGHVATSYENRQADQQVAIDRLVERDLNLAAKVAIIEQDQEALRKETNSSVQRIEASVDAMRLILIETVKRR